MPTIEELAARVRALEDVEEIKRLKYRYFRCLDTKRWDDLALCFTPDATVSYGGGRYRFAGREAIMRFLRESLGEETGTIGFHHGHHPEIELLGSTEARGVWALHNYLLNEGQARCVRMACHYEDRYVKARGAWRIAHTGYVPVFHEEWSRRDTPSVRLLAPQARSPK
ncbi:MAG TPA: nuclear transport factor 2 family protein [Candidatus Binatia bacterium]|nr:nuclear transport factor 2 family protein [Candidatus Binatia bacterium]